jgi:hypothetical protein
VDHSRRFGDIAPAIGRWLRCAVVGAALAARTTPSVARSGMRGGAALTPLELPRREAPDVDVELVEPRIVAFTAELELELELMAGHGLVADGTCRANTRPVPGAIRSASREPVALNCCTSLRAENSFARHLAVPQRDADERATRYEREAKPDAVGEDGSRVRQTGPIGGNFRIAPSHPPGQAARC